MVTLVSYHNTHQNVHPFFTNFMVFKRRGHFSVPKKNTPGSAGKNRKLDTGREVLDDAGTGGNEQQNFNE